MYGFARTQCVQMTFVQHSTGKAWTNAWADNHALRNSIRHFAHAVLGHEAVCKLVKSMIRRGLQCALLASALFISITSASQSFDPHEPSGEVVHLTDENFDRLTDCELPWFIAVTAPWCACVMSHRWRSDRGGQQVQGATTMLVTTTGDPCNACRCTHCQDLEPIWREVAQRLKGEVHVGKASGKAVTLTVIRHALVINASQLLAVDCRKCSQMD